MLHFKFTNSKNQTLTTLTKLHFLFFKILIKSKNYKDEKNRIYYPLHPIITNLKLYIPSTEYPIQ